MEQASEQTQDVPGTEEVESIEIAATVEAILFATDSPLSPAKIAQVAELPGQRAVKDAIAALNERYESMGCAFHIEAIAGGYQFLTLPQYHDVISRLLRAKSDSRLSQAAMETLAVVAYRQPILRADIEAIRGVACGEVLRGLLEKGLVKIVGRAEVLGRPMLYGTTRRFLEAFGLENLDGLPRVEELRAPAAPAAEKAPPQQEDAPPESPADDESPDGAQNESDTPDESDSTDQDEA